MAFYQFGKNIPGVCSKFGDPARRDFKTQPERLSCHPWQTTIQRPPARGGDPRQTVPPAQQGGTTNKAGGSSRTSFLLAMALLIVFMIRSSIVEAFKIPSGSMIPTLHIGDHIFVNKFAYGLKIPFSDWTWISDHPVYHRQARAPRPSATSSSSFTRRTESLYYIKRVIGTPGDTVEMKNKVLFINDKAWDHTTRSPGAAKPRQILPDARTTPATARKNIEVFIGASRKQRGPHRRLDHDRPERL